LADKRQELTESLEISSDTLAAAIETRAGRAVGELGSVNDRVRIEIGSLLERLTSTTRALADTLDTSSGSLDTIEAGLADRLRDFQSTMLALAEQAAITNDQVGGQVETLRDVSTKVLGDVGALAGRLEQQSTQLARAAEFLDETQSRVDRTLEERRVA